MSAKSKSKLHQKFSFRPQLFISLLLAGIVAIFLPSWFHLATRLLCIWDVAMICFLGLTWRLMFQATPEMMRSSAIQEDEGRLTILSLITMAACISVVAITFIPHDKKIVDPVFILHLSIAILTIVGAWLLVHTIFAQHCAHTYYQGDKTLVERKSAGLDFPGEIAPDFLDFLDFSFVIGMICQVSDINVYKCYFAPDETIELTTWDLIVLF